MQFLQDLLCKNCNSFSDCARVPGAFVEWGVVVFSCQGTCSEVCTKRSCHLACQQHLACKSSIEQ